VVERHLGAGRGLSVAGDLFDLDHELAEQIVAECLQRLATVDVPLNRTGDAAALDAALRELITAEGTNAKRLLAVFRDQLAPAVISCDSPRFLSFVPTAPTPASVLFDMIVSAWSLRGISWLVSSGAVAAENQVLGLLADLVGLPERAGGVFVTGGSAGNLSAMVVARDLAEQRRAGPGRLVALVGDQAHPSVTKALHVVGMDALVVDTDGEPLDAERAEAALRGCSGQLGAIVAVAGTTNAGLVDDLEGLGALAAERGAWYHVDAAYGGAAVFSDRLRARLAGLNTADSVVIDPHKWLFAPLECAALLYRRPELAKAVHTQRAAFLDTTGTDEEDEKEEWNPRDFAYHFTRRPRGLPLWFSLALHGTDAYGAAVEAGVDLAAEAARLISARDYLELVRQPQLSIVLFRRLGWSARDYRRWSARLLDEQVAFVLPTGWRGETVARLCFLHPRTTRETVIEVLDAMA
jgi:aromatic-L-amino-acid decarboxylase